jgi:hypothetical protein
MEKLTLMLEFPQLTPSASFQITSQKTKAYNCVAWAAGEQNRWWWPDKMGTQYWPKDVPREATLAAFVAAYSTLGFRECDIGDLEAGFEEVAVFTKPAGTPTHAARQLPNGRWTSKLGHNEDIEHDLRGIEGRSYGQVRQFLKRPLVAAAEREDLTEVPHLSSSSVVH